MSNVLGTSFAQSGFSWDPNLSPYNQSFSYAVRAVMLANGWPVNGTATAYALGTSAFGNPSAPVSTTGTNGTSTLAMRADAAPAIDQGMVPTWTGQHQWTQSGTGTTTPTIVVRAPNQSGTSGGAGRAAIFLGRDNSYTVEIAGGTTTNQSYGLAIFAGDSSSDYAIHVRDKTATNMSFGVRGDNTVACGFIPGAVPYSWGPGGGASQTYNSVVQVGSVGGLMDNKGITLDITAGCYWNGSNWINTGTTTGTLFNQGTSFSTVLQISGGQIVVYAADGGTSGATVQNQKNTFTAGGTAAPVVQAWGPNAAALVDLTPDSGSFTGTCQGFTAALHPACTWSRVGKLVAVVLPSISGSSTSTLFTMTNIPAAITPVTSQWAPSAGWVDNGVGVASSSLVVQSNGTWLFSKGQSGQQNAWTTSGSKGINGIQTIYYTLN